MNADEPITDEWLKEIGFRWHDSPDGAVHWLLWLGDSLGKDAFTSREDLGVEVTRNSEGEKYFCFLRADYSGRYSRFIHIRMMRTRRDLLALIQGIIGVDFKEENIMYGALLTDEHAAHLRRDRERLDRRLVEASHPWNECEKDGSRGYPLHRHQELIKGER